MNLSTSLSLLGHTGNSSQPFPEQAQGNPEGAFASSLLAALAGAFAQPVVPAPNPVAQGLNTLTPALSTGAEAGDMDRSLSTNALRPAAPLLGGEFGAESDLLASGAPALHPKNGQTPSLHPIAPTNVEDSNPAEAFSKDSTAAFVNTENPNLAAGFSKISASASGNNGNSKLVAALYKRSTDARVNSENSDITAALAKHPAAALANIENSDIAAVLAKNPTAALANIEESELAAAFSKNPPLALRNNENPDLATALSNSPLLANGRRHALGKGHGENHDFPPTIGSAPNQRVEAVSAHPLSTPSPPLSDTDQRIDGYLPAAKGEHATSASALATAALSAPNSAAQATQILPQQRQALPNRIDQPSTKVVTSEPAAQRRRESPADLFQATASLNSTTSLQSLSPEHVPSPEQSAFLPHSEHLDREKQHPISQLSQVTARNNGPLSNAEHLMQARAQAAEAQEKTFVKPATSSAAQNVAPIETIGADSQRLAEPLTIASSETGRIESVGVNISKPPAQPASTPNTQIALHIARAAPQGIDRLAVHLHPVELGAVDIQLDFAEDGRVSALITAERPETLDLLQRDSRALERSLNDTGLQLENGGLSFSLKQEQNQQGQGFNASSDQPSQAHLDDRNRNGDEGKASDQEPVRVSQHRLLDIRT